MASAAEVAFHLRVWLSPRVWSGSAAWTSICATLPTSSSRMRRQQPADLNVRRTEVTLPAWPLSHPELSALMPRTAGARQLRQPRQRRYVRTMESSGDRFSATIERVLARFRTMVCSVGVKRGLLDADLD